MKTRMCALLAAALFLGLALAATAFAEGKPVQPGNATADQFISATGCACHASLPEQWAQSMHSKAMVDPVFLLKVGQAQAAAGEEVALFCKRCHSPIGNMIGDPDGKTNPIAAEGVTCMYCHQVVGMVGEPANTSHLVDANLTRRAQIKDPAAPHPAEYSELHTKAEFCGGCHNVDHPSNGTHLESSYTEWAEGPYAKEGVVCQDCHMGAQAGVVGPGSGPACTGGVDRNPLYSMTFVGANVGQGPADASTALLKSAATVELNVPEIVAPGTEASVTVTLTNKGAGHYLPTGLTEVRQMWLAVWAENADGSKTELGEHRFGTVMKDAKGKYPAEVWDAAGVQSDDRIGPRASVTDSYAFTMPDGADQSRVVAALYYKSLPDELADEAKVENPQTEMAAASMEVFASQEAKDAAAQADDGTDEPADEDGQSNIWIMFVGGAIVFAALIIGLYLVFKKRRA